MSFLGVAGLAALLLTSQNNCSIPAQETTQRYKIEVGADLGLFEVTGDEDGGDVFWHYTVTPTGIKSDFRVFTRNRALSALLNASNTSITSVLECNADGGTTSHYEYREYKREKSANPLLMYQVEFKVGNDGKVLSSCSRRGEKGMSPAPCLYATPTLDVPDLFTLLLQVSYVSDLEEMLKKSNSRKALYASRVGNISLQKIGEESVHNIPTVKYKVLGANALLGREVSLGIWLRKEYPHLMEQAELTASLGIVKVERKR